MKVLIVISLFFVFMMPLSKVHAQMHSEPVVNYWGPHPIPEAYGGGFCNVQGAHSHNFLPRYPEFYYASNGYLYFIGDPYIYGYQGQVYWYFGPHLMPTPFGPVWCTIEGPHSHFFPPSYEYNSYFTIDSGYYIYSSSYYPYYYYHHPYHSIYLNHYWPHRYKKYYKHRCTKVKKFYKKYPPKHYNHKHYGNGHKMPAYKQTGAINHNAGNRHQSKKLLPAYNTYKSQRNGKAIGVYHSYKQKNKNQNYHFLPPRKTNNNYKPYKSGSYYYNSGSYYNKSNFSGFHHSSSFGNYKYKSQSNNKGSSYRSSGSNSNSSKKKYKYNYTPTKRYSPSKSYHFKPIRHHYKRR